MLRIITYILIFLSVGAAHAQIGNIDSLRIKTNTFNLTSLPVDSLEKSLKGLRYRAYSPKNPTHDEWDLEVDPIYLDEVEIIAPMKFNSREDRRDYLILQRKVKRVWPYVVLATNHYNTLNERLETLDSRRDKKQYTHRVQNYIEGEFKPELKKLTKTEGQILVKLVYRQTGETAFDLVKELRNGWRAFRYNLTASVFTISLKEEYDPCHVKEDFYIEHILRRHFQYDLLEFQEPGIDLDYAEIVEAWK